tara:strand:+ start:1317 stop:1478 length:162 start_codon:yes stop_codon:yes gene_type:complete
MAKYKLVNELGASTLSCIKDTETGAIIPLDPMNRDYEEYVAWVAEGNTAEAAD